MKKAEISTSMLVWIIIAIIAMVVFVIFFTGKSAGLFGQFKEAGPSESDTSRDACQIACNMAKANNDCVGWCSKKTSSGAACKDVTTNCAVKKSDGTACPTCPASTPTYTQATCTDTDGEKHTTKGTVSGIKEDGSTFTYTDRCSLTGNVYEYWCESNEPHSAEAPCSSGKTCSDGACS